MESANYEQPLFAFRGLDVSQPMHVSLFTRTGKQRANKENKG